MPAPRVFPSIWFLAILSAALWPAPQGVAAAPPTETRTAGAVRIGPFPKNAFDWADFAFSADGSVVVCAFDAGAAGWQVQVFGTERGGSGSV